MAVDNNFLVNFKFIRALWKYKTLFKNNTLLLILKILLIIYFDFYELYLRFILLFFFMKSIYFIFGSQLNLQYFPIALQVSIPMKKFILNRHNNSVYLYLYFATVTRQTISLGKNILLQNKFNLYNGLL